LKFPWRAFKQRNRALIGSIWRRWRDFSIAVNATQTQS
jgi:hypothetical protein